MMGLVGKRTLFEARRSHTGTKHAPVLLAGRRTVTSSLADRHVLGFERLALQVLAPGELLGLRLLLLLKARDALLRRLILQSFQLRGRQLSFRL